MQTQSGKNIREEETESEKAFVWKCPVNGTRKPMTAQVEWRGHGREFAKAAELTAREWHGLAETQQGINTVSQTSLSWVMGHFRLHSAYLNSIHSLTSYFCWSIHHSFNIQSSDILQPCHSFIRLFNQYSPRAYFVSSFVLQTLLNNANPWTSFHGRYFCLCVIEAAQEIELFA